MKIKFIYLLAAAIFAYIVLSGQSGGTAANSGGGRTGAPGEGLCEDCHNGGTLPATFISVELKDSLGTSAVNNYTGGRTYTISVTISSAGVDTFGAQATVLQTSNNFIAGILSSPSANARLTTLNGRQYLEQRVTTASPTGRATYTATWVAPAVGTGSVRIFASGVAANGNGAVSLDNTAIGSLLIPEVAPTTISYPEDSFCLVGIRPTPIITGVIGGVFSATPNGLNFINTSSGQINPELSNPGRYIVSYTYNTPPSVVVDTIFIVQQDQAIFRYPDTVCKNSQNPIPVVTGTANGTFSCLNPNMFLNSNTGEIDLTNTPPDIYSIVYLSPNVCADTQSRDIKVIFVPAATITYPSLLYCGNTNTSLILSPPATLFTFDTLTGATTNARGGNYSVQPNGVQIDPITGEILLNVNAPFGTAGAYRVVYTTTASCPSTTIFPVTIESPSVGIISYPEVEYCENAPNQGVTIIGAQNGRFFSLTNTAVNRNTGELNIQNSDTGLHVIGYIPLSLCADTSYTDTIRIDARRRVDYEYPSVGYCLGQQAAIPSIIIPDNADNYFYVNTTDPTIANSINANSGRFPIPTSMLANLDSVIYTIIRRDSSECGSSDTTNLTVYRNPNAHFYYPNDTICNNAGQEISPYIGGVANGIFNISPNTYINDSTGILRPDSMLVGQYLISYNSPSPCAAFASQNITFVAADSVSFRYTDYPICIDGFGIPTITSASGSAVVGYFSARALDTFARNPLLFANTSTGAINLNFIYYQANLLIPNGDFVGQYEIAYHVLGTCPTVLYDTIQLSACLNVRENTAADNAFLFYPNPTQQRLFIQNSNFSGELQINIYNLLGQPLLQNRLYFSQQSSLDLSTLEKGIYLLEIIYSQGQTQTAKILKE